ncbi:MULTISPECIES: restriction endonuclease subunit S [Fusobacterium]|uniref:Restriction endonuclease subunit S n=4 Tax=Fusobacterium TaxID=848 RepID=A0A323TXY2_FUSNU|nr:MULTISPECIES: restriction endonuclease subunit S [Fusobacterium]PCR85384.1 type I restriction endonuclease subunit S [Fusobacterium nucleatum]PZA04669.1 restriction endonuclease subunit S [Fusobacterium nucleatum]QJX50886.1 restriction endonuclease subunit S [Fusobacterium nucleatum]WRL76479.1 restriction endonuclease subunit S [Fusobacterium polymorphum]HCE31612.1 type I restriction endonuclease subunit S [Fusobacterium sp.]
MNKNIQYKKLTDICEIITGEWGTEIKENSQNIVSVIRTTNFLNNGKIDIQNKELVKREMDKNKIEQKKLKKGDIIIEKSGGSPNQPVGRVVFFNLNSNDIFLCNNFTSILRIKEKINSKYIFYFLRNSYKNNKVLKFQNKTTGIINLKLQDYLNGSCIYLPELRIQNKVVNILDILESILEKNQNYLNYLKELTKSLFTKYSDSKIVKSFYIKDISSELFAGGDKPNDYSETTSKEYIYPVYSNGEKKEGLLCFSKTFKVDKEALTISARGTIGFTVIRKACFTPVVRLITLIPNKNNNIIYLKYAIEELNLKKLGSGVAQLTIPVFSKYKLNLPPIELQNKFAERIEKIEKLKFEIEKSIEESQKLYNSLISKYFDN